MTDTPPARHREWIISSALVALAGTVFVGARALEPPASTFDEFLPLVAAQRVLAGEVPYRDYTTQYPPLMTWLDAALLSFAKPELLATRALCLAIVVVGLVVVTRLAARIVGSERKGAAIGLATALAHGAPPWSYSLVPATVLVLSSFLATLRARASGVGRPRAWLAVAGLLLGLAALARHEAAAFGAIPVLGAVFLSESARGRRAALSSLAIVAGTAAVLPLAFLVFVVASGAASGAWEQLVRIPALVYPDMRRLPWPLPWRAPGDAQGWPAAFSIYAPFVVGALALGRVVREWRAAGEGDERGAARLDEGALASLALVFVLCATVRADRAHVYAA
ncbi:glycosyltransferase family 39 protein, partial [bacterium]|nr:glycosyltransferase family 39 protein [bacterium]